MSAADKKAFNNAFEIKTVTKDNWSLPANQATNADLTGAPAKSGYTRNIIHISMANATTSGSGSSQACAYGSYISGDLVKVTVANRYSSAIKIKISVIVLYINNTLII